MKTSVKNTILLHFKNLTIFPLALSLGIVILPLLDFLPAQAGVLDILGDICGSFCQNPPIQGTSSDPEPNLTKEPIQLPAMGFAQDTDSDCGPHSAARALLYLGYGKADGFWLYKRLQERKSAGNQDFPGADSLGTTPHYLAQIVGEVSGHRDLVNIEREVPFKRMKEILIQNYPVIALVRTGTMKQNFLSPTVPLLHWIVVVGFDDNSRTVYYYDTNGSDQIQSKSYNDFLANTAGADNYNWTWRVGPGVANAAIREAGATTSTFLWIKQYPWQNSENPNNEPCQFGSYCAPTGNEAEDGPSFNLE